MVRPRSPQVKILAIETSCDDTSVAVIETSGRITTTGTPQVRVLSSVVSSQTELHTQFGGVVPNLARREHEKNLPFVLEQALMKSNLGFRIQDSGFKKRTTWSIVKGQRSKVERMLAREVGLVDKLIAITEKLGVPNIDAIAVTQGPGLEPALWVGVNAARALAVLWNKPLIAVNHMEGHLTAVLLSQNSGENVKVLMTNDKSISKIKKSKNTDSSKVRFPAIGLLVSGGHTQLVLIKKWGDYKIIGETRDDAVGETFDKVARMLGLPYPGGPEISRLAKTGNAEAIPLPRPMLRTKDYAFSYSGLKTAVLYYLRDNKQTLINDVAASFQQAAIDPLIEKTLRAVKEFKAKTIILGGGVAANDALREQLSTKLKTINYKTSSLFLPEKKLTTDNAAMIGAAAIFKAATKTYANPTTLKARADLRL